jgi:hypothetical protein
VSGPTTLGGGYSGSGFALNSTIPVLVTRGSGTPVPTRMGFLPAGTLIINDDATSRVWIGPASSTGYQAGTPLDPKTTFTLTRDGEYFATVDPSGTTDVQLYCSPYIDNWQPSPAAIAAQVLSTGITVKDNPTLIGFVFSTAIPVTTSIGDVRQYQSFTLSAQYEAPLAGPPANTCIVTIEFGDSAAFGNILSRQTYEINSVFSTDCGRTTIIDNMAGPFMRILLAAGFGVASTVTWVLYGSYRTVSAPRFFELGTTPARGMSTDLIVLQFAQVLAFGVAQARNVRAGTGLATLHCNFTGAGGPYNISLFAPSIGAGTPFFQRSALASGSESTFQFMIPRRVLSMNILNSSAGSNGNGFVSLTMERY